MGDYAETFGKKQISINNKLSYKIREKIDDVNINRKSIDKEKITISLNEKINKVGYRINSITYSVYIFGIVLLILFIALIY